MKAEKLKKTKQQKKTLEMSAKNHEPQKRNYEKKTKKISLSNKLGQDPYRNSGGDLWKM